MKNSHSYITDSYPVPDKSNNDGNGGSRRALFENDDIFHMIAENSSDLILHFRLSPARELAYISPSSIHITGYTPEEYYTDPETTLKCIYPEDTGLFWDFVDKDTPSNVEPVVLRWIHKDGRIIWMEQAKIVIRNKKNKPVDTFLICRDITGRKQAEEALRESEKKFRNLFEHAKDAVILADAETGILVDVNTAGCSMLGLPKDKILGMHQTSIHPPEMAERYKQVFREHVEKGIIIGEDIIVQRADGSQIPVDISASVINLGEKKYIQGVFRDITERKQAEEKLRESQKFVSSLLENAPHATIVINPDTSIRYVNPAWEELNGWTLSEIIGTKAPYPWWPDEFKDAFLDGFKEAMIQGSGKAEIIAQKKSGETYWINMNWASVTHNGELQYLLINSVDITEHKQADEALIINEERFRLLADNSTDLISRIRIEPETKTDYVSPSCLRITGYTQEDFYADPELGLKIIHPEDKEFFLKNVGPDSKNFDIPITVRLVRKDGRIIWTEQTHTIIYNERNEPVAMHNIAHDITERKQAEEALANEAIWRRILIDESRDGIVVLDENSKVFEANQRFAEMLGYSPEEVRELYTWDWDTQWKREELLEMGRNVDAEGLHLETQHRRKDGTFIDVDININGAMCAGQKLVFCVCRDVTERKQAEEALRESEEKFSAAFHSSPDLMAIVNIKTVKYTEVNDSFVHFTGYSREELIGHTNQEINMWVNAEEEERMGHLLDETGQMRHEEFHFRTKSGEIRTWLCSADIINIGGDPCMLAVATDITESKKAQEALRESEERFSKAFDASPGSMSISHIKDGTFIEVNESFLRDKGYTRDEVIGHNSEELGLWKDPEHRRKIIQILKQQGRVRNEPTHFRTKSGEIRSGYLSAEFITLGNEPCMIVLTTDTTQLMQAQEQLRLLSSVTQQVSDSTVVINPDFKITYMNQASQDLFGYTLEEAQGKFLGLFDPKPMTEKGRKAIFKTISNGKVFSSITAKRRKDGSTIICDCRLSPLYDDDGEVFAYIDVHRDITKQKEVEAKLQVHKKLIERILATMPEGVLVIDRNDRIILANEAFHRILHTSKKAIENKPLIKIVPVNQLFKLYKAVIQGNKENNTLEFRHQVKDLEKIINCDITKMDGERTLLTFSDVSQEREEEEKLYLTDRLASIGEMAAGLAHELNNPLTGVLALSQMLMDSDIPEEHLEDLQCVYSEAKRAASIVKNVLLFARNNNYENGQASTNEVIQDVLRLREYEEKVSNITAVTHLQDDLPDIPMDKFQLQQVFLNITLNAEAAIKETNRAGTLTVTTERVNNHININFKDNGCGIKKHILPRIFDPFFTTKDIGKGTGLGLSICYGIVVKHGGKINVKTHPDKGTTFTIKMPVVRETA